MYFHLTHVVGFIRLNTTCLERTTLRGLCMSPYGLLAVLTAMGSPGAGGFLAITSVDVLSVASNGKWDSSAASTWEVRGI